MRMDKKRKYKMTSYGEYEFVVKKVYSENAIKKAHEKKINRKQVITLVKKLSNRYLNGIDIWVWFFPGKKGWQNEGGVIFGDDNERFPVISLINMKSNLRVGIVLHEFAHAMTGYKYGIINHGKSFIKSFNKVLRFYFNNLK